MTPVTTPAAPFARCLIRGKLFIPVTAKEVELPTDIRNQQPDTLGDAIHDLAEAIADPDEDDHERQIPLATELLGRVAAMACHLEAELGAPRHSALEDVDLEYRCILGLVGDTDQLDSSNARAIIQPRVPPTESALLDEKRFFDLFQPFDKASIRDRFHM